MRYDKSQIRKGMMIIGGAYLVDFVRLDGAMLVKTQRPTDPEPPTESSFDDIETRLANAQRQLEALRKARQ